MNEKMTGALRAARATTAVAVGIAISTSFAAAQDRNPNENWSYDEAYQGWSAEHLMNETEVLGPNGEELGSVENLLIDDRGQIVAVIAQLGGFLDIGDTHVAVPWDRVSFQEDGMQVPVTGETVEEYSIFADQYFTQTDVGNVQEVADDLTAGFGIWKASDLMDDYAVLETGVGYGYISDLIFDDDGMLESVVVNADNDHVDTGYYGYPWYGYGYDNYVWEPGFDRYVLPFDENEISDFATEFDYDMLDGDLF